MSFASDARGEMVRERVDQPCCARAELAAALEKLPNVEV